MSGSALVQFAMASRGSFALDSTQAFRVCSAEADRGFLPVEVVLPGVFGREREDEA